MKNKKILMVILMLLVTNLGAKAMEESMIEEVPLIKSNELFKTHKENSRYSRNKEDSYYNRSNVEDDYFKTYYEIDIDNLKKTATTDISGDSLCISDKEEKERDRKKLSSLKKENYSENKKPLRSILKGQDKTRRSITRSSKLSEDLSLSKSSLTFTEKHTLTYHKNKVEVIDPDKAETELLPALIDEMNRKKNIPMIRNKKTYYIYYDPIKPKNINPKKDKELYGNVNKEEEKKELNENVNKVEEKKKLDENVEKTAKNKKKLKSKRRKESFAKKHANRSDIFEITYQLEEKEKKEQIKEKQKKKQKEKKEQIKEKQKKKQKQKEKKPIVKRTKKSYDGISNKSSTEVEEKRKLRSTLYSRIEQFNKKGNMRSYLMTFYDKYFKSDSDNKTENKNKKSLTTKIARKDNNSLTKKHKNKNKKNAENQPKTDLNYEPSSNKIENSSHYDNKPKENIKIEKDFNSNKEKAENKAEENRKSKVSKKPKNPLRAEYIEEYEENERPQIKYAPQINEEPENKEIQSEINLNYEPSSNNLENTSNSDNKPKENIEDEKGFNSNKEKTENKAKENRKSKVSKKRKNPLHAEYIN